MERISIKQLWFYPILFGLLGALTGLVLRFAFAGLLSGFPLKNLLHSHSHVMLLGFLFNALVVLLWSTFAKGMDRTSFKYYLALQVCVGGMLITFILQGYALFSIIFSTLHLWLSYIFLIRLWKQLKGAKPIIQLIRTGIVLHFVSSIGPYCLGPLMAMDMQESPWYQQAIFFYLHFQYFGSLFVWLLSILMQNAGLSFRKYHWKIIIASLLGLYAHSLDYSFDHWIIQWIGTISSVVLLVLMISYYSTFRKSRKKYFIFYVILLCVATCNIIGSFPAIITLVETSRFMLIAWLHFLFLCLYVPFIWAELPQKIGVKTWIFYGLSVLFSELILIFPTWTSSLFNLSVMHLLLIAYSGVFLCFSVVHLRHLFKSERNELKTTR